MLVGLMVASAWDTQHYQIFYFISTSEINWAGLIMSMTLSSSSLSFISLCYRFDYHVSSSEEIVVGPPSVKGAITGAEDLTGTVVQHDYATSEVKPRPRFRKYYYHAAMIGWLAGFPAYAALNASGLLDSSWEYAGFIGIYSYPPFMTAFIFVAALFRGHVRKLWNYKEEWGTPPSLEDGLSAAADVPLETNEKEKELLVDME